MSLMDEYRRRHEIDSVWPVNEGVLFFERKGRPELICITSSHSKSASICPACPANKGGITLEVYRHHRFPQCAKQTIHLHMPPDGDLLEYIRRHVKQGDECIPVITHGDREQERWVWEFFLMSQAFRGHDRFAAFVERQQKDNEPAETRWIGQAMYTMERHPDLYRTFYIQVYSLCLVNRTYILRS